jgi:hypothetical protein
MAQLNKLAKKKRDEAITCDFISGLTYKELEKKYKLSNATISRTLSSEQAKRIIEASYKQRAALLPLALLKEAELMQSDNPLVVRKMVHKLIDDMGIGRAHTPSQIVFNILNQQNNYASPELLKLLDQYRLSIRDDDQPAIEAETV